MKMDKKIKEFVQEFVEESTFRRTISIAPKFLSRRLDLVVRDPMAIEMVKEADKLPLPINEYTPRIEDLSKKLQKKWNVMLLFTRDQKYRYDIAGRQYEQMIDPDGTRPLVMHMKDINDNEGWVRRSVEPIWFRRIDASAVKEYQIDSLMNVVCGDKFSCDDKLLIVLDLNLINSNDAKFVKKTVWNITKKYLDKRKKEGKKKHILDEPDELLFLYHCRDKTFQNYLRWYDLHMDPTGKEPNGFSFRAIAFCNYLYKNKPELYADAKIKISNRTKEVRSNKGKRTLKGVIGEHIDGEDAVEKGVKIIYRAIHRKPYPSKKTKQKEYNCPTHGVSCPADCSYKNDFMKDFNRRNMLFKPLNTLSPEVLEQVVDDEIQPKRKKQKKLD